MAFIEGSKVGALDGPNPVTIVDAPPAGTRRIIKNITIINLDSADVYLFVDFYDGEVYNTICLLTLAPGDTLIYDDVLVLKTPEECITAQMADYRASQDPNFVVSYGDAT